MSAKSILLIVFLLLGMGAPFVRANEIEPSLNTLNKLLTEKKWEPARQELVKIRALQPTNHHVFYNLGNIAYQQNQPGWAAAYYHKAQLFNPRDEDTLNNLNLIQKKFKDDTSSRGSSWWDLLGQAFFWNQFLGLTESAWLVLFLGCVAFLWTLWVWRKQQLDSSLGVFVCYSLLAFVLGGWLWRWQDFQSQGILVAPQVEVRSGMLVNHTVLFVLHEGAPVRILQKENNFCKIEFTSQQVGWVPAESVAELRRI